MATYDEIEEALDCMECCDALEVHLKYCEPDECGVFEACWRTKARVEAGDHCDWRSPARMAMAVMMTAESWMRECHDHRVVHKNDPPSISRSGRSISVWTGDQLRCFLDAMADHELYPLYLLAATTGMRRGELAGLPWSNVDLDAARLTVNQQIVSVQYQLIEGNLKTPTSRRSIDLDLGTVAELRRHRRRQLEERMATGQRGDDGYVFAKPDGSPIHPDLISQTFERAVAKLDVPRIRLHDLRHTHATTLLQQNVHPKVVSERLGHSSVAFTMTVYQHVMPGLKAQAASTFETAVFGQ